MRGEMSWSSYTFPFQTSCLSEKISQRRFPRLRDVQTLSMGEVEEVTDLIGDQTVLILLVGTQAMNRDQRRPSLFGSQAIGANGVI